MGAKKPNDVAASEKEADALIAIEKVKTIRKEGILMDDGIPYSHSSTYGGRFAAFIPKRIKAGNTALGLLIFLIVIITIELLKYFF